MRRLFQSLLTDHRSLRRLLLIACLLLSIISCYCSFQTKLSNIYGDGIAHLNIARRVLEVGGNSWWQHYAQLGSPWLPVSHLLVMPLVWQDYLWRNGLAGSLISMVSYLLAIYAIFELAARLSGLMHAIKTYQAVKTDPVAGLIAAMIFALNPSLLYLQTTPMTELPFLASFAIASLLVVRWAAQPTRTALILSAVAAAITMLTRYEGWTILPAGTIVVFLVQLQRKQSSENASSQSLATTSSLNWSIALRDTICWFAIVAIAPLYWFWHNYETYGNILEFANGYYSARGIFRRQQARLGWTTFAVGHSGLTLTIALIAAIDCSGLLTVLLGIVSLFSLIKFCFNYYQLANNKTANMLRSVLPFLLLPMPFGFTLFSLYTNNIQIYPFTAISLLNVRYGTTITLALSVLPAVWLAGKQRKRAIWLILALIMLQYSWLIAGGVRQLAVVQEPLRNAVNPRNSQAAAKLAAYLRSNPPKGKVLMAAGELTSIIAASELNFHQMVFANVGQSPPLDDQIETIIVREDEACWSQLRSMPAFQQQFSLIYQLSPAPHLMVWQRRAQPVNQPQN